MPTHRSINIALHSQFDVETFPEYDPLPQMYYTSRGVTRTVPEAVDDATSTCSAYIPVLPGSTFWIGYSVSPPVPEGHYFLFKLYINGAHIVSWSTGKEEGWKGKTMFGLYERSKDEDGKRRIEKRMLCFTASDKRDRVWRDVMDPFDERLCMEIRVHRAHGRKRVERQMEEYKNTQHAKNAKGINLVNAGRASTEQPKRYYTFALTDPVDQPFCTFRYYYRTWEQLRDLGLLEKAWHGEAEEDDLSVIEPYEGSVRNEGGSSDKRQSREHPDDVVIGRSDGPADAKGHNDPPHANLEHDGDPITTNAAPHSTAETRQSPIGESPQKRMSYIPRGAPGTEATKSDEQTDTETGPQYYRLSVPPSIRHVPTEPDTASRPLPSIPQQAKLSSSTAYHPHPAYPADEWRTRTPSPVQSVREGVSTPPLGKQKGGKRTASSLMSAITTTWKRRGTPSSESRNEKDGDVRRGARSAFG